MKKLLGIILCACLALTLCTTAWAAEPVTTELYIGGVKLIEGQYLYEGQAATSTAAPTGDSGYAYLVRNDTETYTLTLHNYSSDQKGRHDSPNGQTKNIDCILFGTLGDKVTLRLVLEGDNTLNCVDAHGIFIDNRVVSGGAPKDDVNMVITGQGSLTITGRHTGVDYYTGIILLGGDLFLSDYVTVTIENVKTETATFGVGGIEASDNITISDHAMVTVECSSLDGAMGMQGDNITITGGTVTVAASSARHKDIYGMNAGKIIITGGTVLAQGSSTAAEIEEAMAMNRAPDLSGYRSTVTTSDIATDMPTGSYDPSGISEYRTIKIVPRPRTTGRGNGDTITSAKTFDVGIALYGGMALLSACGAAYVTKKK